MSRGGPQENRAKAQEHGVGSVLLQVDWEISEAYRVVGTPSAVLITPEGKVASPVFGGEQDIEALADTRGGERAHLPVELPVAQPQAQGEPCPNCGKVHPNGHTEQEMPAGPKVGEPAPEIALPDLEGQMWSLRTSGEKRPWCSSGTQVWVLPADAPRPEGVGRGPPRGVLPSS